MIIKKDEIEEENEEIEKEEIENINKLKQEMKILTFLSINKNVINLNFILNKIFKYILIINKYIFLHSKSK